MSQGAVATDEDVVTGWSQQQSVRPGKYALTDFNFSYLSESRDVGLVIEGVILLGVGFAADRLRRRIGSPGSERTPVPVPADVPQA